MRDGRSKTATDNKSYDDTFYRSIGEQLASPHLCPPWKGRSWRESSSFLERDHLCCRERACLVLARRQSITLGTYYPAPPRQLNHRDPPTRLLAPLNTIHLRYPRSLAPSASRHVRDLPSRARNFIFLRDVFLLVNVWTPTTGTRQWFWNKCFWSTGRH